MVLFQIARFTHYFVDIWGSMMGVSNTLNAQASSIQGVFFPAYHVRLAVMPSSLLMPNRIVGQCRRRRQEGPQGHYITVDEHQWNIHRSNTHAHARNVRLGGSGKWCQIRWCGRLHLRPVIRKDQRDLCTVGVMTAINT